LPEGAKDYRRISEGQEFGYKRIRILWFLHVPSSIHSGKSMVLFAAILAVCNAVGTLVTSATLLVQ